jgi:hypothetical protein
MAEGRGTLTGSGTTGSLSFPLAQQWGAQIDGAAASNRGIGSAGGGGHVFWRDPSIALLGVYGSYSHWDGINAADGHLSADTGHYALEGEYYWSRWTVAGLLGAETAHLNAASGIGVDSIPTRFFDWISASYYPNDNLKLSIGRLLGPRRISHLFR